MTSRQTQIQEDTNFTAMRILEENPDFTHRELAEKLGVSVGGLNSCHKALMGKGWVKMQNFRTSKNKFKFVYLVSPKGIAEKVATTSRFPELKMKEYQTLKEKIESLHQDFKSSGKNFTLKSS